MPRAAFQSSNTEAMLAAGYDPKDFAGHSLRAGFVTSALEHGADMFKVMDVTRHRRVETLKGYDRRAKAFRNHAGGRISVTDTWPGTNEVPGRALISTMSAVEGEPAATAKHRGGPNLTRSSHPAMPRLKLLAGANAA
jgi:hypothetical protein